MEDKEMMNINEVTRLQDWLKAHGIPPDEREDCIKYIAAQYEPNKKETPPPSK